MPKFPKIPQVPMASVATWLNVISALSVQAPKCSNSRVSLNTPSAQVPKCPDVVLALVSLKFLKCSIA